MGNKYDSCSSPFGLLTNTTPGNVPIGLSISAVIYRAIL